MRNLFLLISLIPLLGLAQADSSASAGQFYLANFSDAEHDIYNGREHIAYPLFTSGHAYYLTNEWQQGTLEYRNTFYSSVFLKYDLIKNELIIRHFNGLTAITLFTPRIQCFSIAGKSFIRVGENDRLLLPSGFYEEVVTGKIGFYIKRTKQIDENLTTAGVERKVLEKDSYYALKDGIVFPIKKEKNILELMKDKKGEIKNDLRRKGLSYKHNTEEALTEIVTYYNEATN